MSAALKSHRLGITRMTNLRRPTVSSRRAKPAYVLRRHKLTSCLLVVEGDDLPTFTGKYPRLTTCPSKRAPRKGNHILQKEQIARTAKAQRKRIDRSRKAHKRFSPVPVDNEIAAFQQSHPAIWPKTSFAVRPKFSAGVKTKEKEGSTRKSKTKTLCIRTKS